MGHVGHVEGPQRTDVVELQKAESGQGLASSWLGTGHEKALGCPLD